MSQRLLLPPAVLLCFSLLISCSNLGTLNSETIRLPADSSSQFENQYFVSSISSLEDFKSLARGGEGLVKGGVSTKFLVDVVKNNIYFLNSNFLENGKTPEYVKYHYNFAQKHLGTDLGPDSFNKKTYFTADVSKRFFVAGTLQSYELKVGLVANSFLGIQFYPQDLIAEKGMLRIAELVRKSVGSSIQLGLVSYGEQQTFQTIKAELSSLNIRPYSLSEILAGVKYIPMNAGEAWGFPKVFPTDLENLSPTDLPIFKDLPLDLSVVAGTITTTLQDPGSHINLKSKERGTPNMIMRNEEVLAQLIKYQQSNTPIYLKVENTKFTITPTTAAIVATKYKEKLPKKWVAVLPPDKAELTTYDEMCKSNPTDCLKLTRAFGGKASKLGLLANPVVAGIGSPAQKQFGYRITPYGFGIPLTYYQEFVDANPELKQKINSVIKLEMADLPPTPKQRALFSQEIHDLFYKASFPNGMLEKISAIVAITKATVEKENPGIQLKKIKFRSSANVEDLEKFNGAGLHDSFGAKLSVNSTFDQVCATKAVEESEDGNEDVTTKVDMEPESIACAIKGVYASLWNKRALEERSYKRFDHSSALMGIAVVPSYNFLAKLKDKAAPKNGMEETANSVLVTRVLNSKGTYGYTISSQEAPNLVTNPSPGTLAEVSIASFLGPTEPISLTYTQFAKPISKSPPKSTAILSRDQMLKIVELAKKIDSAYCKANPAYYPEKPCSYLATDPTKKKALDMEFKYLGSGSKMRVLVKQMREFSGE